MCFSRVILFNSCYGLFGYFCRRQFRQVRGKRPEFLFNGLDIFLRYAVEFIDHGADVAFQQGELMHFVKRFRQTVLPGRRQAEFPADWFFLHHGVFEMDTGLGLVFDGFD